MLLEILQCLHPLSWVPLFQKYVETQQRFNKRELFGTPITQMYGTVDLFYFQGMHKQQGEVYKRGILDLLNLKYTHKYFRALIHKHYNYDMEAMLRILDPNIFRSYHTKWRKVQLQLLNRYVPPTHTNEGCFTCGGPLATWFPSLVCMTPKVLRKQMANPADLKKWVCKTKHMIQVGCCSELCFLVLFRTNRIPNRGDPIPQFRCDSCGDLMTSFEACMGDGSRIGYNGAWDLESMECRKCIVSYKYSR